MALTDRQYLYDIITLDLNTVRSDTAQGLTKKINSMTIMSLGGGILTFKLNANTNKSIPASDALETATIPITDIFWTNAQQVGKTATIFIVWVD